MAKQAITPVDIESTFAEDEIIVSKTNEKGHLLYVNDVFCRLAEMNTEEVIGEPHSIIRHPDMPRAVFKLLWDTIQSGNEIFAYVKNMSKSGKYYWVIAHVTPSYDSSGRVVGYHSNRRSPKQSALEIIKPLYQQLLQEEQKHSSKKVGMENSFNMLVDLLKDKGLTYDEFIWEVGK